MWLYQVLPNLCNHVKFCQKYGIMGSFAKNMELWKVWPKIWNYMMFCQKYKVMC
jgi:hypothetical protein